ncbi:MAG: peptide deformylase [Actinobacteria bacterium]|nr:peptide deformylase [Actinomycetota bacterium]
MAIRNILLYPHPILAAKAEPIKEITDEIKTLAADMLETMVAAQGIGLAANQIGITQRILVIDLNPTTDDNEADQINDPALGPHVMINPIITQKNGSIIWEEGCLSIPDQIGAVERSAEIEAVFTNLEGEMCQVQATELMAVCIQHEIDHLNGIVYPDRMHDRTKAREIRLAMKALKSA